MLKINNEAMQEVTAQWLSKQQAFLGVPFVQLEWFIRRSRHYMLQQDEALFSAGEPIPGTQVIISGKVNITGKDGIGGITATLGPGEVTGMLPFSRMTNAASSAIASVPTQVMVYPNEYMREMAEKYFELTEALVHQMLSRVRTHTSLLQQNEKMMALGKLSAGLAHELNNPASAVVRDAISLKSHLAMLPESFKAVMNIRMKPEEVDAINDVLFESLGKERPVLTLMEKMELEDQLDNWLKRHGINNSELVEAFTDFGYNCEDLDAFSQHIPDESLQAILKWIADNIITDKIVEGIADAAQRIESLVNSIKSFTHMDRGRDKESVDIHIGIRNTLTMLAHKLRNNKVTLNEQYDLQLPPLNVMVGEMNQVWTNLIDNALDSMESQEGGLLEITSTLDGNYAKITVTDNGPGIPSDIINSIFDPFFTTKPIGKGTGLGLEVVRRIIQQHNGTVKVDSRPGRTSFMVCLPINAQ